MVWHLLESMARVSETSEGMTLLIACVVGTMTLSFVFFPPTKSSSSNDDEVAQEKKYLTYSKYEPQATWSSDFQVLRAMWFAKITGNDLQERLNSFYEHQADLYDSYRCRMLHGRPKMLQAVTRHLKPPNAVTKKKGIVWVDLACGTGYNMESFKTCLDRFQSIYLLDLCVPLCQVAQRERADKYNKANAKTPKIKVIHGDATDFENPELPPTGTVDLVTLSYSLVMIPDWRKAIANAQRLLKPGTGVIAISDFTVAPDQWNVTKTFWTKTFESDHVFLNPDHLPTLYREFDVIEAAGSYGPIPYTPFFLQPAYYYFVGKAKNRNIEKESEKQ